MSIVSKSILNGATYSGGVAYKQPYSQFDSGAVADPLVWMFPFGTTRDGIFGMFTVPEDYVDTAKLIIGWNGVSTSLAAVWDWDVLTIAAGGDPGAAFDRTSETVEDEISGTTYLLNEAAMTLTDGDYTAGDTVYFGLYRDQTDALDDLTVDVALHTLRFQYANA